MTESSNSLALLAVSGYLRKLCVPKFVDSVVLNFVGIDCYDPKTNKCCKWEKKNCLKIDSLIIQYQYNSSVESEKHAGCSWSSCVLFECIKKNHKIYKYSIKCNEFSAGGGQGIGICSNPEGFINASNHSIFPFDGYDSGSAFYWYFDCGGSFLYQFKNGVEIKSFKLYDKWDKYDEITVVINTVKNIIQFYLNKTHIGTKMHFSRKLEYYLCITFNMPSVYEIESA